MRVGGKVGADLAGERDPAEKGRNPRFVQFSDEDAKKETPVSACGNTLGIVTTVRIISAIAVNNYIRFVKGEGVWTFVEMDGFAGLLETY